MSPLVLLFGAAGAAAAYTIAKKPAAPTPDEAAAKQRGKSAIAHARNRGRSLAARGIPPEQAAAQAADEAVQKMDSEFSGRRRRRELDPSRF